VENPENRGLSLKVGILAALLSLTTLQWNRTAQTTVLSICSSPSSG